MSIEEEGSGAGSGGHRVDLRRRRWSEAQKRQIVAESHEPGVSVSVVARRYNVNANQIFKWRRLYRGHCHVIEQPCRELVWNSNSSGSGDGLPQVHCVVAKLA